ncbi:MAG: hypothetical protein NTW32_27495 [Chloroflexi bacterium]|nr:hypothetical protein [Chloroflexota bacterium]
MFKYNANPDQSESFTPGSEMPVDTVKIMFHVDPSKLSLNGWEHIYKDTVNVERTTELWEMYRHDFFTSKGIRIGVNYYPSGFYSLGNNVLFVELSLPKVIFGCNHQLINFDWEIALEVVQSDIACLPGFPLVDIRLGILFRLDICVNFQVGNNVKDYFQALRKAHYRRRKTLPYNDTGVLFKTETSGRSLCLYDKMAECKHKEAYGLFRAELSLRNRAAITSVLDEENITLPELTRDDLMQVIRIEMKPLGLDRTIVCDRLEIEHLLSQIYTPRQVRSLLGYWLERQTKTYDQMIEGKTSVRTICHYEKLLKNAGIASISSNQNKSLPPLF